ncbi:hypothetical protein J6590_030664 [Homalodisca vitripennis]|nr:hypothetical protein J6590_030664 [Homalodisca vitripennis]
MQYSYKHANDKLIRSKILQYFRCAKVAGVFDPCPYFIEVGHFVLMVTNIVKYMGMSLNGIVPVINELVQGDASLYLNRMMLHHTIMYLSDYFWAKRYPTYGLVDIGL